MTPIRIRLRSADSVHHETLPRPCRPWRLLVAALLLVPWLPMQAQTIDLTGSDAITTTSFNTGLNWDGGLPPSAGNDYATAGFNLRTPHNLTSDITFAGDSLTINGGNLQLKHTSTITIDNLILAGGAISHATSPAPGIAGIAGNINVTADSTLSAGGGGEAARIMSLLADISGGGNLTVTGNPPNNTSPRRVELRGDNSGFTGDFIVNSGGDLQVHSATGLGATSGAVTVNSNGRVALADGVTITGQDITIAGNGADNLGALRSTGGATTWAGNVTLAANNTRLGAVGPGQSLEVAGVIGDNGAGHTLAIRSADGGGTVILSGQSTYGGDTHVVVGPVQLAGGDNRLPTGSVLRMGNTSNVASASFDLNGNNQTVAGLVSDGTGMSMVVTNSSATPATLTVNNSGGNTYNGVLSGNLALTKTGGGSLTLGGSAANNLINDYTGLTTVTEGTLFLNKGAGGQAIGGDILINGGNLRFTNNNPNAGQIAPTSNLTITSGNFNSSAFGPVTTAAPTETLASVTLTGGSFSSGSSGGVGGDFTITGATTVDRSGGIDSIFNIGSGGIYRTHSLSVTDLNAAPTGNNSQPNSFIVFGNSSAAQTTLQVGPGGLTLDNSRISMRMGGGGALGSRLILDGDLTATGGSQSVLTADTTSGSSGTTVLELSSTAAPVIRNFHVDAGSTFATSVFVTNGASSEAGITMTGPGILRFSGSRDNSYTGLTTISGGGTFQMHSQTNVVSVAGDLLIENGSRVTFTNSNQFAPTSNVTMTGAGSVFNGTATNSGQANVTQTIGSLTVSGGSVNLGNQATGLVVNGASSFTGGSGNTIFVGNSGGRFATDSLSLTNMNQQAGGTVATNNSFTVYGNSTARTTMLEVGSGGITLENSRLYMRRGSGGAQGSILVLDGDITALPGAGNVNTIQEDTSGGTSGAFEIQLSSTSGNHMRTVNVVGASTEFATNIPVTNGAADSAGFIKTGEGIMRFSGGVGPNTYTGPTIVQQGRLQLNKDAGLTSIAGDLHVDGGFVTFGNNNQISNSSNVFITAGALNGLGVNTGQRTAHQETFASLTVTGGAFNTGNGSGGIGSNWTITGHGSFTGGTGARFVGNSGGDTGSTTRFGSLSLTDMNGTGGITAPNTFDLGAGNLTSVFVGPGGLSLDNSNIRLAFGAGGARLVLDGDVTTTGNNPTGITIVQTGSGANQRVELSSTAGSHNRTFDIGANAPLSIDVPVVDGAATEGGLIKTGDGTMILAADNTYSGPTDVQAGTLLIDGDNSGATGDVTVQSGATLGGNGTVGGATVIAAGGTLAPGSSAGTLTFNQDLTLAPGATFDVDVLFGGTDTDLVVMTPQTILSVDGATLAGTWGGSDANIFRGNYNSDTMFWVVDNQGTAPIDGRFENTTPAPGFAGLFDGVTPYLTTIDDQLFAVFYESQFNNFSQAGLTGGNDLLLMSIPEPSRALLLAAAALGLLLRRRR